MPASSTPWAAPRERRRVPGIPQLQAVGGRHRPLNQLALPRRCAGVVWGASGPSAVGLSLDSGTPVTLAADVTNMTSLISSCKSAKLGIPLVCYRETVTRACDEALLKANRVLATVDNVLQTTSPTEVV